MRKIFAVLGLLTLCSVAAKAGEQPVFEVAYSTYMTTGIRCSTGTVIQVNASRPAGFKGNLAGYRIVNQDSTNSIWIGGPSVSSSTTNGDSLTNLGEKITSGNNAPFQIGKTYMTTAVPLIPLFCLAADAAGAGGVVVSVAWFGY